MYSLKTFLSRILVLMLCQFNISNALANDPSTVVLISHSKALAQNKDAICQNSIQCTVMYIDGPDMLAKRLGDNLTGSTEARKREIRRRMEQVSETERLSFVRPILLINQWDITKLPAMVFNDGESVIYGVSDFAAAIDIWREKSID